MELGFSLFSEGSSSSLLSLGTGQLGKLAKADWGRNRENDATLPVHDHGAVVDTLQYKRHPS